MAEQTTVPSTSQPSPRSRGSFGSKALFPAEGGPGLFFSNLKDFLTDRPAKLGRGSSGLPFTPAGYGGGFWGNLADLFRPLPPSARQVKSQLFLQKPSGIRNFLDNLRMALAMPNVRPAKGRMTEIGTRSPQLTRVQALSLAFHVAVLVLLVVPLLPQIMSPPTTQANTLVTPIDLSDYAMKVQVNKKAGGGGGGGERSKTPASSGKLAKFSAQQLAPPSVHPMVNPRLAVTPTVIGAPDLKMPSANLPNYGDPLSKLVTDSNGSGAGSGIGTGTGTGVGSGEGAGVGPGNDWGTGGGYPNAGENGYGVPECLYCPRPEFTDEAVKAKYQGVVELSFVVELDGRASHIVVVKGLGLGLDEKAIAAVRNSRFKPSLGPDGKPSAARTLYEVTFRLY